MSFNIEEFRSHQNRNKAYARTNKFHVRIGVPQVLLNGVYTEGMATARFLEYYIQDGSIPGIELVTGDVRRHTYGPNEKRPYGVNVAPVSLLINNDGSNKAYDFFEAWISSIIPHDYNQGMLGSRQTGAQNVPVYQLSYKQEYATEIEITAFAENKSIISQHKLIEAFPSSISNIAMSWGDLNQIQQFTVEFQYLDWFKTTQTAEQQNFATQNFPGNAQTTTANFI